MNQITSGKSNNLFFLIEWFFPLSSCCVSSLAVGQTDRGDADSPLPALSALHDKWSILESIMDSDVGALFSLDTELSSLVQALSHLTERCLFVLYVCFFLHVRENN